MSEKESERSIFNPHWRAEKEEARFMMSPAAYLTQHNIQDVIQDALLLLCESKPEEPLQFLANYFAAVSDGTHVLFRRFRFINATPRNRRCFIKHFRTTYASFDTQQELSLDAVFQLLCLLCVDFPFSLLRNASRVALHAMPESDSPTGLVKFTEFSERVLTLFYFAEFMNESALAFRDLDSAGKGSCVDRRGVFARLSEVVVNRSTPTAPSLQVLRDTLLSKQGGDSEDENAHDGGEEKTIMFNVFCVHLFAHPAMRAALCEDISLGEMRKQIGNLGSLLIAQEEEEEEEEEEE